MSMLVRQIFWQEQQPIDVHPGDIWVKTCKELNELHAYKCEGTKAPFTWMRVLMSEALHVPGETLVYINGKLSKW